jgi:hypothetical protein
MEAAGRINNKKITPIFEKDFICFQGELTPHGIDACDRVVKNSISGT